MNDKRTQVWKALIATLVFIVSYELPYIFRYAGLRDVFAPTEFSVFVNICQIILCIIGIIFAYRIGLKKAFSELGLRAPFKRAIVFSIIATLPMLIGFALTSSISPTLSMRDILAFTVISPFAEEIIFRGYIFRQLYRKVKMGFWPAVLLPSLLFGLGHFSQSTGVWDFIGITLITGLGGIFFSWTFIRWKDNLWVPFGLHFLMNFWWMVFAVDDTALGGWLANIVRFLAMIIAIVLTLNKDKIWKPLVIV